MRKIEKFGYAAAALVVTALSSGVAHAGIQASPLPAPGIVGLVAGSVIAAIAVARLRK